MNIILLSGGSGKRLWPLSNDIRSKQFLKLFKRDNGEYESMVQRVYRQIKLSNKDVKITIATSKSQVSAIYKQLGDNKDISVCVEPCRRDTFPAIALATAYLKYELNTDNEESIVVCPVDPFVDDSFFKSINELEEQIKSNNSKLYLMGIEPTYPSDKYGYIIPKNSENISVVKEFKEKPSVEVAKEYLKEGALWNAGVFAFKLGYLIKKAHDLIDFTDYRDLVAKYESLKKISFDYEVVEKETSVSVFRYKGEWKDVGTWNMMTSVMSESTKGNVFMDDTCEKTQVINELSIPTLCMGCKNMVIAISRDGILVSDKERSGYIKPYVEKIGDSSKYMEKSWGTYSVLNAQPGAMTVKLYLSAKHHMTYHSHALRDEVWAVLSGKGTSIVDEMEHNLNPGDVISIAAGSKHTLIAETDMNIIEVQVGEEISSNDKTIFDMPYDSHTVLDSEI